MPKTTPILSNISGMGATVELQSDGRSFSRTSKAVNKCHSNKAIESGVQSLVSPATKFDITTINNGSQDGNSASVSIRLAIKSSTHDGTSLMGDSAAPQVRTERGSGVDLFNTEPRPSVLYKATTFGETTGKSMDPFDTGSSIHKDISDISTSRRRSSRISKAPARYANAEASVRRSSIEKKDRTFEAACDKEVMGSSVSASSSPRYPIDPRDTDVSLKVESVRRFAAEPHLLHKGPGRPRKRQKDEEPLEETEAAISEPSHKKRIKLDYAAVEANAATTTPKPALKKASETSNKRYKIRGRRNSNVATKPARKTRGHSSAKNLDPNLSDSSIQPPSTERSSPPDCAPKLNFAKLNIDSLHSFVGDAMGHYASLPKKLGDPNGFKALYRTFFPSSSYQHYAKVLELEVSDLDLREAMREIWEMVNGGENDKEVILHRLGLSWAKKGAPRKLL